MAELLLDSNIRVWVFLPIVVITFLIGILRHYVSILISSQKKVDLQQVQDSQALIRSRFLRENGKYLPKQSFLMRKNFFNNEETGYFKAQKRPPAMTNPMTDPAVMTDMLKGNVTNVLPMIMIGGWINWTFSGFVTSSVPAYFAIQTDVAKRNRTVYVKRILVIFNILGILKVSSASWYFLNVFGLRSIYTLVLGENNAADQARVIQEQMSGAAMAMPPDPKQAFKAEWEALEICEHQWALRNAENEVTGDRSATLAIAASAPASSSSETLYLQSKSE